MAGRTQCSWQWFGQENELALGQELPFLGSEWSSPTPSLPEASALQQMEPALAVQPELG